MALSNMLVVIVVTLVAALIQAIGSATAPLVSAAIEAHKEKCHRFDFAISEGSAKLFQHTTYWSFRGRISDLTRFDPKIDHDDSLTLTQERAREMLARFDQEREEAKRDRQAGRPQGKLTADFVHKLRNCNVLQLKRVKQIL
jgi:hypothetical protein